MIIHPTPFLARSGIYRGPVRHVAFSADRTVTGSFSEEVDLRMFVSGDGRQWYRNAFSGDLRNYLSSAVEPYGAFQPQGIARSGDRLLMYGAIYFPSITGISRIAAVFATEDGREWNRSDTPIDGTYPPAESTFDEFLYHAVHPISGRVLLAFNSGRYVVSDDFGDTWEAPGYIGGEGNSISNVAVSANGIWIASNYYTDDPTEDGWPSSNLSFPVGGSYLVVPGGSVFVSFSSADGYAATAPANAGTPWTLRTTPANGDFRNPRATYQGGRFMAFQWDVGMVVSTNGGVNWSLQANRPNVGERLNLLLSEPDQILAFRRDGKLIESINDGVTWGEVPTPGIDIASIVVAGSFAAPV